MMPTPPTQVKLRRPLCRQDRADLHRQCQELRTHVAHLESCMVTLCRLFQRYAPDVEAAEAARVEERELEDRYAGDNLPF